MTASRITTLALALVLLTVVSTATAGEAVRYPHWRKRCPVCGMFIHKYPEWTAQVHYTDGTIAYFDGAKDMFTYLFNIKTYHPERTFEQIEDIWVREYYGLTFIDARKALFVIGSDVLGPMGHELVPLGGMSDVNEFIKDHGGDNVLTYDEVSPIVIDSLN